MNSGKQWCVLLALSPQTFHKSGMATSVHSFSVVSLVNDLNKSFGCSMSAMEIQTVQRGLKK